MGVLRPPGRLPSRDYFAEALFEIRKLLWLIEQNDLLYDGESAAALAKLMSIDPNQADYGERVAELLDSTDPDYENTRMGDNLKLEVAKASPDIYDKRAGMLMSLAHGTSDAAVQANYELAMLLMHKPVLRLRPGILDSVTYFQRVAQGPPNPWTKLAAEQLARLAQTSQTNGIQ